MGTDHAVQAHAPTVARGPRHDGRSVGELLRDADHLARTLLLDLSAQDAPTLLRSWGEVADAAHSAWVAIDAVATARASKRASDAAHPPPVDDTHPMLRLHAVSNGIRNTLGSARWPGPGPGSPAIAEIAGTLERVADLLRRSDVSLATQQPRVRADLAAADMRLMHVIYVCAHATTSALQLYGQQLHVDSQHSRRPIRLASPGLPYGTGPTGRWIQRVGVCEGIAGRHVRETSGGFASATGGEAIPTPQDPSRLPRALVRWDIQVHRSLAAEPSPHNVVVTTRVQAYIAATSMSLLSAVQRAGLTTDRDLEPLTAALEVNGTAWNRLASRWSDLALTSVKPDPDLTRSAGQMRAAARELAAQLASHHADHHQIEPVGLREVVDSVQHAIEAAVDVAHLVREPTTDPDLTGPARLMSVRAHNDAEHMNDGRSHAAVGAKAEDTVWVTPADVLADKQVPVPRPVVDAILRESAQVITTSQRAASLCRKQEDSSRATSSVTRDVETWPPPPPVMRTDPEPSQEPGRSISR